MEKRVLFVFVFMHEICVCLFGELNYVVAFEFVCVCIGSYLVSLKRKLFSTFLFGCYRLLSPCLSHVQNVFGVVIHSELLSSACLALLYL